jgi:extracellular elastinolytic metalloproteinase
LKIDLDFGKGGHGNDPVRVNNQAIEYNGANFATPGDGQPGIMNIFTWTTARIRRDGSLVNCVLVHEYTHGLSNRLTGGPKSNGCLSNFESLAMGEGWGMLLQ